MKYEEDKDEEEYLQYEKLTPSWAGSLLSGITAVPSATLTLSLLRDRQKPFKMYSAKVRDASSPLNTEDQIKCSVKIKTIMQILTRTESSAPEWYRLSSWRSWPRCTFLSRRMQGASRSRTTVPDTVNREAPFVLWSSLHGVYK